MMFDRLGHVVVRHWRVVLAVWVVVSVLILTLTPEFQSQVTDGEFAFLPTDSPSLASEKLFRDAFPISPSVSDEDGDRTTSKTVQQNPLGSNIVLVVRRADPLTDADYEFIDSVLVPAIERTADEVRESDAKSRLSGVWTYRDSKIGPLLVSEDKHATLVLIELTTEFLDRSNYDLIVRVEDLIRSDADLSWKRPTGLDVTISGSATVGRDMLLTEHESGQRVETVTPLVVIGLLVLIYRAPLIAIVPLTTVAVAILFTLRLLAMIASWEWVGLFNGLEVYIRVVMYGAGVDYCLFLIARYREELDEGGSYESALAHAVGRVGPALATSAGTSLIGIGMMTTADFGKFRQAGFGIAFGLAVVLISSLTLTPAILALLEKSVFWPQNRRERAAESGGLGSRTGPLAGLRRWFGVVWDVIGQRIERHPARWLVGGIMILLPFVLLAPIASQRLSYGLLSDLPQTEPSVIGAIAVQEHFPAGVTGPASVLISIPAIADPETEIDALELSKRVTEALTERQNELQLADVRSQAKPLGVRGLEEEYISTMVASGRREIFVRNGMRVQARKVYLSSADDYDGTVLRFDLTFEIDPFARDAIQRLDEAEAVVQATIPEPLRASTTIGLIGPTASIRDLKDVTDHDETRIQAAVAVAVYVVIVLLLRRPAICLFLIISVVVSYMATIGMTYLVFYLSDPDGFNGLDWKVPIFLFTLLIALGEDYNIFLMSRIVEEQKEHGVNKGVREALSKTGGIISSCGLIMAGTFAALMTGTLLGMVQMGFALTAGVLLDTFLVRPVIVPAWLMWLSSGRLGRVGHWLGGREMAVQQSQPTTASPETATESS